LQTNDTPRYHNIWQANSNKLLYLNRISQFFIALKEYSSSIFATFSDDRGGLKQHIQHITEY